MREGETKKGRSDTDAPQDRKETRGDEGRRACEENQRAREGEGRGARGEGRRERRAAHLAGSPYRAREVVRCHVQDVGSEVQVVRSSMRRKGKE